MIQLGKTPRFFFSLDNVIERLVPNDAYFVQIGANDGLNADPLHHHVRAKHLRGLLVEPLPDLMSQLKQNYDDKAGLEFAQCAITREPGPVEMLRYDPNHHNGGKPEYADLVPQIADSPTISDRAISNMESQEGVKRELVEGVTLRMLLQEHNVKNIDLLQIDTEGYDFKVLSQLDFTQHRPIIHFEYVHLPTDQKRDARELLADNDYAFILGNGRDMLAVPKEKLATLATKEELAPYQKYLNDGSCASREDLTYAVALLHQGVGCMSSMVPTGLGDRARDPASFTLAVRDTGGVREPNIAEALDAFERMRPLFRNRTAYETFLQEEMPRMQILNRLETGK